MFGQVHECWDIFETERTKVREIVVSDVPALFTLYGKPGAADYVEPLYDYDEEVAYTEEYINKIYAFYGYGMWVVTDKKTEQLIGRVGFEDRTVAEVGRILEFGYMIDPDYQHQGIGTEVCRRALQYAYETLDEPEVTCLIEIPNEASKRFISRFGFRYIRLVENNGKTHELWRGLRDEKVF